MQSCMAIYLIGMHVNFRANDDRLSLILGLSGGPLMTAALTCMPCWSVCGAKIFCICMPNVLEEQVGAILLSCNTI